MERPVAVMGGAIRSLHVVQTFGLYDREGRSGHVRPLALALATQGDEVSVIGASYPPISPPGDFRVTDGNDGGAAFDVTLLPGALRFRSLTVIPGARGVIAERLTGMGVDLVHVHGLYDLLGPSAAAVCRQAGVPYVVETMGMFRPLAGGILRKRLFMRLFGRNLLGGAARLVATSGREADDLKAGGIDPRRIIVRHNGVEPFAPAPGAIPAFRAAHDLPDDRPIVLFLGRLAPVKNIGLLLAAFQRLSFRDALLVIAGPPESDRYLRRLRSDADRLGLGGSVRFVGPLFGEEKAAALEMASMLVLSSINENFGIVALEAMAAGTPVVVTETCGVAEYVREGGGLVVGLDAEELRAAIDGLLADAGRGAELGGQGRDIATTLSWDEAARLTGRMYGEILTEAAVVRPRA